MIKLESPSGNKVHIFQKKNVDGKVMVMLNEPDSVLKILKIQKLILDVQPTT